MDKNHKIYLYYRNSLNLLFTNKIIVLLHLMIEYLDIYAYAIDSTSQIISYNQSYSYENIRTSKYLFYISPYYYFTTYLGNISHSTDLHRIITIAVILVLIVLFFICFSLQTSIKFNKISSIHKFFLSLYINFYDYLFFRTFSIVSFNTIVENLFAITKGTDKQSGVIEMVLLILITLFGMCLLSVFLHHYKTYHILSSFKFDTSCFNAYPFDNFFSLKYDIAILFVKILITANQNYLYSHDKLINSFQLFVSILLIIIVFGMSVLIAYHFLINPENLVLYLLTEANMLRIFLLEFTSVSIILKLMFHDAESDILFVVFGSIVFVFLIFLVFGYYRKYIIANAETSTNYLGICWFFQANDIDRKKFIIQWMVHHKTKCSDTKCDICLKLYETQSPQLKSAEGDEKKPLTIERVYSPYQFVMVLYNERRKENYKTTSKDEKTRIDFILLTVLFLSSENQMFKLYKTLHDMFVKYKDDNVLLTLLMVFEIVCKVSKEIIKSYKMIRKSENLITVLKDYIGNFDKFIHFETKTPENFLKISAQFNHVRDSSETIIKLIKKDDKCNYQTRLVRYLYETVLSSPLKLIHNESEISASEEFLIYKYENDKVILLQYSIEREAFTIIKGSKDILKYKDKPFDVIFPDFIKDKGSHMFMNKLQNKAYSDSKKMFSFVIKDLQQPEEFAFVQDFKMIYSIFPSNKGDEMLISINYMTDYDDLLIFELSVERGEENLFSCSKVFQKILGLNPEVLQILSKSNYYISFNDIFTKETFNFQNEGNTCLLQYQRYGKAYKTLMKCEGLNDAYSFKELKDISSKIKEFSNRKKELSFLLTEKFTQENDKKRYVVYNVTDLSKDKEIKKHRSISIDAIDNELQNDPIVRFDAIQATSAPTISGFSTGSCQSSSQNLSSRMNGKTSNKQERKEKSRQVQYFTFFILGFGLFIMFITLLFLIFELQRNSAFQSLFQLFQSFKYFKRHVECIPLSIISNLCYEKEDGSCEYHYENYALKIKGESATMNQLPTITSLINAEVASKINEVMNNFNKFLNSMHDLDYAVINDIGSMSVDINEIKVINDKLLIETLPTTFIDLIRTYSNYQTALLTNSAYKNQNIKVMLINEEGVITSEDGNLSETQRHIYRLILNYPPVHKSILKSSSIIETCFKKDLIDINRILMGFFFPLLVLHLLLCGLCIFFLRLFIQMLKTIIISIVDLFSNQIYLHFIDKRIDALKLLSDLYRENPMKLINRIQHQENEYKRKLKELYLSRKAERNTNKEIKAEPEMIKTDYQLPDREFSKIIFKYKAIIIALFSVHLIYSVTYYIFINDSYINLTHLVSYGSINTLIDHYIYDNVYSMQYLAITNTTPYDLSLKIYDDHSIDYVKYGIDQLYTILRNKETLEKENSKIFPPINEQININCSQSFPIDPFFKIAFEKIGVDYLQYIKALCDHYQIGNLGTDTSLIKEILYLLNQLSAKFNQSSYSQLISFFSNSAEYDAYTVLLVFNRILRTYFNQYIFKDEINYVLNHFTTLIIVFLVFNMFFEIFIFFILNFFIITHIRKINKELSFFILSLKFDK